MTPQQVAEQLNACGAPADVALVHAWESGEHTPTETQLIALADVLWCRTTDLMGVEEPRTLGEHRLARQFTTAKLADSIGMDTAQYEQAEERRAWSGDERQTAALLRLLNLTPLQLAKAVERSAPSRPEFATPPKLPLRQTRSR
ncbi:helix-turn-helix transcriptional regulator [Streptomyces asoensis]|uniref:helix-turn-helix transcriptional regulator n=1 Tax=Streptomyces asoensis TaxID=249586 RepID=UPI0033D0B6D0